MTVLSMLSPGPERLVNEDGALRLQHHPCELRRARAFADAAAARFGLSSVEREDFKLAVNEAVANAIEHGEPCWDGAIHVWTTERDDTLTLGVRNGGEFDFRPLPTDPLAEHGRGLTLIADLVDAVALSRVGNHIQVELSKERSDGDS
jgi:anti-sigma regulatory factor (Ser/Thr protein kinase)